MQKTIISLAVAVAVMVPVRAGAFLDGAASPNPVQGRQAIREGRVLGDYANYPYMGNDRGPALPCQDARDCRDWLASGCTSLVWEEREPAWIASIVNVAPLAGTTRLMSLSSETGWALAGVAVQFWTSDCHEVSVPWSNNPDSASPTLDLWTPVEFRIPDNVTWMTVTGFITIDVQWHLY